MAPMNPRLLRPLASGVHPEAAAWRSAVVANSGGTPSASTMRAVSKLCADIDAAGIRDRFFRLGIFAGPSLNSALVPLYRGPSPTGTQYGNATDSNANFIGDDYAETGAAGGLKGKENPNGKSLDTGLQQATVAADGFMHLSVFIRHATYPASPTVYTYRLLGLINTSPSNQFYFIDIRTGGSFFSVMGGGTTFSNNPTLTGGQLLLATRSSDSDARTYLNATEQATDLTSRTISSVAANMFVFAENRVGTGAITHAPVTLGAYSMGLPMTASQVTSFNSAMASFQTALNRNSGI
jgi:hypothetical protein